MSRDNNRVAVVDLGKEIQGVGNATTDFYIGRSAHCHIVLDDKQVSREHAKITFSGGKWTISQNTPFGATLVNGMAIRTTSLQSGDMIIIGPFQLMAQVDFPTPIYPAPVAESRVPAPVVVLPPSDTVTIKMDPPQEESISQLSEDEEATSPDKDITGEFIEESHVSVATTTEGDFVEEKKVDEDSFVREEDSEKSKIIKEKPENEFSQSADFSGADFSESALTSDSTSQEVSDDQALGDGTVVFQAFAKFVLEISGEFAPYDKYVLNDGETIVGRNSRKCQIVLNDTEVSGIHSKFIKKNAHCMIEDLQSVNGTLVNGARTNKVELVNGDIVQIGSTQFVVRVSSGLLEEQSSRLMPVEENQEIEVQEVVEVAADFGDDLGSDTVNNEPPPKSLIGKFKLWWGKLPPKSKIIYGAIGLALFYFLVLDDSTPQKEEPKKGAADKTKVAKEGEKKAPAKTQSVIPPDEAGGVEAAYQLAKSLTEAGKYEEALFHIEKISNKYPDYKNTRQLHEIIKQGFSKLEEIEKKRKAEEERRIRLEKVKELVVKAKEAVKDHKPEVAEAIFGKIMEMDPENYDVPQLKSELDAWKKEQDRISLDKAQKEQERKRQVGLLSTGKGYYLKKEWYKSIFELEKFLKNEGIDEDLMKEGSSMLVDAKKTLEETTKPLIGKAKSLKEGQDLKGAYETFVEVLKYDPANEDALNDLDGIKELLVKRAMKVYREALIDESLSHLNEAKEKFQEVLQISPEGSDYYRKAKEKLDRYPD